MTKQVGDLLELSTKQENDEGSLGLPAQSVLVVDDEQDILISFEKLFKASLKEVNIVTALNGNEALKMLERQDVDLIITDYKMPGLNGLEFLAKAREVAPKTPRILMTAFPDMELAINAINQENIERFLTKPLDPKKMVEEIRALLYELRAEELRGRAFARTLENLRKQITQQT